MTGSTGRRQRARDGERYRSPGQRQRRVGEEVRHALARILRNGECRDPALQHASITVSEVRLSPDLRSATAYVMPLAGADTAAVVAGLKRGAPFLRARVAHDLQLRHAPDLIFALDETFDQADRIAALLSRPEVARDLDRPAAAGVNDDDVG
ncbi:MAG TPA: 30S ribosome-binding factor RbfA [Stellaceae bacterium]|nr:30S ribosome-binding factor RbfA [Stellaceae bacterium]